MAAASETTNGGSEKCDTAYTDLRAVTRMLTLNFGLASGVFTPAVRDGQGKVTEKAILKPPARDRPAFIAALGEAAEQCVEVLVTRLKFKLPEVPQQSASGLRSGDKRTREDERENEEEEEADATVFEEGEEAEPEEFFRVENYVPPEHEEKVEMKLQEEEAAGRM
ncbi:hypothetical protein CYMTET_15972, partial [Cymbomonas tetramitiformis]